MHALVERRFPPRRTLGRTGFAASPIGIGDLADRSLGLETCVRTLRRALEAGLNVVDTAPAYENGFSEEVVGRAIADRRRDVFLIDKIDHLDRPVAPQIAASLGRLGLPQVDLFVFHGVSTIDEWNHLVAPGGGFEQLKAEIARGRARFAGISSHHPMVLDRALDTGLCDVLMFPLGPFCDERYVSSVLPRARQLGVGVVSFKTFGAGKLVADTSGYGRPLEGEVRELPRLTVEECVRYTLTLEPDVALLGLSTPDEQDAAFAATEMFVPLSPREVADVRARAAVAIRQKGRVWWDPPVETAV